VVISKYKGGPKLKRCFASHGQGGGSAGEASNQAPAVTMWLDVVRHHGEAIEQDVAAVSCRVKCGHRDEAVTTLTEALTDKQLTVPARAKLRALQAWLMAA
jgi:hypothetical protein